MSVDTFTVNEDDDAVRLDVFLARALLDRVSRTKIKACIEKGGVTVNGKCASSAHLKLNEHDVVTIDYKTPDPLKLEAQKMPLDIVFEDKHLLIINKPAGLVVHPGAGKVRDTLVNALLGHMTTLSSQGGAVRPGIVHRIDKDTSGLLVVAKTDAVHRVLAEQFKEHSITRGYFAVVKGVVQHDEGKCDAAIGPGKIFKKKMVVEAAEGREAVTYFSVVERFRKATLIDIRLETGRTHQIRVHMAHYGHPVIGDAVYGVQSQFIKRQALHAYLLGFIHPVTKKYVEFKAALPADMRTLLDTLRAE